MILAITPRNDWEAGMIELWLDSKVPWEDKDGWTSAYKYQVEHPPRFVKGRAKP